MEIYEINIKDLERDEAELRNFYEDPRTHIENTLVNKVFITNANEIFGYIEDNEGLGIKTLGSGHSAYADAFQAMMDTINTDVVANNI